MQNIQIHYSRMFRYFYVLKSIETLLFADLLLSFQLYYADALHFYCVHLLDAWASISCSLSYENKTRIDVDSYRWRIAYHELSFEVAIVMSYGYGICINNIKRFSSKCVDNVSCALLWWIDVNNVHIWSMIKIKMDFTRNYLSHRTHNESTIGKLLENCQYSVCYYY